jgi:5-methylcytosine-specific restriction endonuclease McrA
MLSISERVKKLRNSQEYKNWHAEVLKRDNYKCILCGDSEKLEVDHIKSLSLFPHYVPKINKYFKKRNVYLY